MPIDTTPGMRVLLINGMEPSTSYPFFERIAADLRADGLTVDLLQEVDIFNLPEITQDVVVSHIGFQPDWHPRTGWYGGQSMTRAESLRFMERVGMPTMPWATAANREEMADLFPRWETEWILMKRSGTHRRKGTTLLHRDRIELIEWDPQDDVFCQIIDPDNQDVYMIEFFAGEVVFSSRTSFPPLSADRAGTPLGLGEVWDFDRVRVELPSNVNDEVARVAQALMELNYGFCSVDLMKRPDGEYVAIELNLSAIGLSFSSQFDHMAKEYADGVRRLIAQVSSARSGGGPVEGFDLEQVSYRKARLGEIKTLVPLARELVGNATDRQLEKRLRRLLLRRGYRIYALIWRKGIIGMAIFRESYFLGADAPSLQIIGEAIDPEFRGNGISAYFMNLLSGEANSRGYSRLWLVTQHEHRIELCESLGFANSGYWFTLPLSSEEGLPLKRRLIRRLGI